MIERLRAVALPATLLLALAAPSSAGSKAPVRLEQAAAEVPESQLVDVGVVIFRTGLAVNPSDPGAEEALAKKGIFPEVRRGEARYFPVQLARTLQLSGHWGAVSVVPSPTDAVDVLVSATILESNGHELELEVWVDDTSGRRWFDRRYRREADVRAYAEDASAEERRPYTSLYNEIANDLLAARRKMNSDEIRELRQISFLRFAADLAPDAYGDYLRRDRKGRYRVDKLPAEGDPIAARIERIRERDYLLVDTFNEQYATFHASMEQPYLQWRSYSFEEEEALRKLRRQARTRKVLGALAILGGILADGDSTAERAAKEAAVIGGTLAVQSGIAKGQEAKIHREAIKELGASFESEVEPMVVDVEGQRLRLEGSAATRYATWRKLLREIVATETGIPLDPDAAGVAEESRDR